MPPLLRLGIFLILVLFVPVVPFLLLGQGVEHQIAAWFDRRLPPAQMVAMVVGLLAVDVFLPVPSSFLSTLAGARLGILLATLASWTGLMAGAVLAFSLARIGGHVIVARLINPDDRAPLHRLAGPWGIGLLIATRPIPVLAEGAVLLMGTVGLSWGRFLPAIALSNFGLALAYSVVGHLARQEQALLPALGASIGVPVAAMILFRLWLPKLATDG